jgi:hypothetical protein
MPVLTELERPTADVSIGEQVVVLIPEVRYRTRRRRLRNIAAVLAVALGTSLYAIVAAGGVPAGPRGSGVSASAGSPVTLSGSGQSPSKAFSLHSGLVIVSAQVSGSESADVVLENDHGVIQGQNGLLLSPSTRRGSAFVFVTAGTYKVQIDNANTWTVTVSQPRADVASATSTRFSGFGPAVIGPIRSLDLTVNGFTEEPGGRLVPATVQSITLANEQRVLSYFGWDNTCAKPPPGPYYIEISVPLHWTVVAGPNKSPWMLLVGPIQSGLEPPHLPPPPPVTGRQACLQFDGSPLFQPTAPTTGNA